VSAANAPQRGGSSARPLPRVLVHDEVAAALAAQRPVVALETAVVSHGLPRTPAPREPAASDGRWSMGGAINLETARLLERTVRAGGAVPATIALVDGALLIGLTAAQLEQLALDEDAAKASARDLAGLMQRGRSAGTTVAATLAACMLATPQPIRVFATGGIGGAHRGWSESGDISADLEALASTPVCVVSAGVKSILDLPATLEMLDTHGVPIVGHGTDALPRFVSPADPGLHLPLRCDEPEEIARLCELRWNILRQRGGILVANPAPESLALPVDTFESALRDAEGAAIVRGIRGPALTPFLLAEVARLTDGRSIEANIAVLASNARVAAAIAVALQSV